MAALGTDGREPIHRLYRQLCGVTDNASDLKD